MENGSAYSRVNRQMIKNLEKSFCDFRKEIRNEFRELKQVNQELYNHLSSRLPPWAIAVGSVGIALISGTLGAIIKSQI